MLAFHDRLTVCWEVWVPTPVRVWLVGEFDASLTNEMFPVDVPTPWGAKVTV